MESIVLLDNGVELPGREAYDIAVWDGRRVRDKILVVLRLGSSPQFVRSAGGKSRVYEVGGDGDEVRDKLVETGKIVGLEAVGVHVFE